MIRETTIAIAGFVLSAGLAQAQTPAEQIASRIGTFASNLPASLEVIGDLRTGELADGAGATFKFDVDTRRAYLVVADCHVSCDEVILTAINDEDDSTINDGQDRRGLALALINPLAASKVRIKVEMKGCTKPACTWGAAVFAEKTG